MIESAPRIGCNRCKGPLCNVSRPHGLDLLSCPNCGVSDTYDNVMLELDQRTADALSRALNRPVPSRDYRFALLFRQVISKPANSTSGAANDGSLPVRQKRNRTPQGRA
jgi:hypothetical protein